ncbi:UNVERIFIED_CONTAM: hypothetical protein ODY05_14975, partial [Salmonella enterica subsp. enterica serovar Enteritidis]
MREIVNRLTELAQDPTLAGLLTQVQEDFPQSEYSLDRLQIKAAELIRPDQSAKERLRFLERAAAELTSRNAPKWEDIAARILNHELEAEISGNEQALGLTSWQDKLEWLTDQGLLSATLLASYTPEELTELA